MERADGASTSADTVDRQLVSALTQAIADFRALLVSDAVAIAWQSPSVLAGYTVGGLVGHVVGLMERFDQVLGADPVEGLRVIPCTDWYGGPPQASTADRDQLLVALGEGLAASGADELLRRYDTSTASLCGALESVDASFVVPLASVPGAGVRLVDFVRTRVVEIVVHAEDVTASIGSPPLEHPLAVSETALAVVMEAATARYGAAEIIRLFTRPGRLDRSEFPIF